MTKTVLDETCHHGAGEVFIDLRDIDVARLDSRHRVEPRRERLEIRGRVIGSVFGGGALPEIGTLRRSHHVRGLLLQVARAVRAGQDHGGGAIVLHAAVVEMERLDDPSRLVVGLARERTAVHHGARIELRVVITGHRDRGERVLGDAMLMHEAAGAERDPLRGRGHPVWPGVRRRSGDGANRGGLPEAAELALRERSVDYDAGREACDDRGGGVADRAGAATTAATPEHGGEAQLGKSERGGDAHRIVSIVAVRRDSVDRGDGDAGVIGGALNRFEREPEFADRRGAAFVVAGLAEAGDSDLVLDGELAHLGNRL